MYWPPSWVIWTAWRRPDRLWRRRPRRLPPQQAEQWADQDRFASSCWTGSHSLPHGPVPKIGTHCLHVSRILPAQAQRPAGGAASLRPLAGQFSQPGPGRPAKCLDTGRPQVVPAPPSGSAPHCKAADSHAKGAVGRGVSVRGPSPQLTYFQAESSAAEALCRGAESAFASLNQEDPDALCAMVTPGPGPAYRSDGDLRRRYARPAGRQTPSWCRSPRPCGRPLPRCRRAGAGCGRCFSRSRVCWTPCRCRICAAPVRGLRPIWNV